MMNVLVPVAGSGASHLQPYDAIIMFWYFGSEIQRYQTQ